MTGAIDSASLGHPQAVVSLVQHFAETGLTVTGVPAGWRRVRRDADLVTVSDLWLSVSDLEQQELLEPSERFVSNAMATAWLITDLPTPAGDLLQFAEAMTSGVPGWKLRERIVDPINPCGVVLLGSLESPFGTLTSNAHSVVLPRPHGQLVLAQLAVTALSASNRDADTVRLLPRADFS